MTKPLRLTWSDVYGAVCAVEMKEQKDGHLKYERREHPLTEGRQKFNQNLKSHQQKMGFAVEEGARGPVF